MSDPIVGERIFEGSFISESKNGGGTHHESVSYSTDSPVFIVGLGRGGTTLLSRMLDAHSDIAIFPETWWYVILDRLGCIENFTSPWQASLFFNEVWENLRSYRDPASQVLASEAAKQPKYVGPTFRILERLGTAYAKQRGAKLWGEKTPGHALWLPQIRSLFPRAKLLFMVRDPRDVIASYDDRWNQGRRDTEYAVRTAALLKFYLVHLLYDPVFPPQQVHWVKYEELTAHPAEQLQRVCAFLGIEFQPSMVSFHERHQSVESDMAEGRFHSLLSKPATTEHVGRYEKEFRPSQIALVEKVLGQEMQELGYPLGGPEKDFSPDEEEAFDQAQSYYNQMLAGDFRKKLRREGRLKLQVYRIFGRALHIVPSWRIANSAGEWGALSEKNWEPKMELAPAETLQPPPLSASGSDKLNFQSEMGRISRQSGIVFAGTIFTATLGYVFKIYLAHALGAEALGVYALGMTIISFLGIVNVMGLPEASVRFVAQYVASKRFDALRSLLWNGSWMLLAANLIFAGILMEVGPLIATRFYHSPQMVRYLPLFALIMVTGALNSFFSKVLGGYKEVGQRTIITRFIASPLTMILAVALIALGGGLWGYLAAQILSATVATGLLILLVWRLTPVAARSFDVKKLWIGKEVWSFAAAIFGIGLMEFLISQTDRVALGFYRGAHDVGIYAVAAAVVAYEPIILQSVNQIFAPVISDVHTRGQHVLLKRLFQTLTKWMLGLTLPLAIVVIVYAQPIMRIFGHDFESGWPILVVGTCGQIVNCAVGSVGYLLLMSGNQRRLVRVQGVMAAVMVALSIELVPHWGAFGAALAAALTNAGTNTWNLLEVRKALGVSPHNYSYLKLLPPVGGALLAALLLRNFPIFPQHDWVGILAALVIGYAIFVSVALAMGLDADDSLIMDAVWRRVRSALA